jgi:hypothetical protein
MNFQRIFQTFSGKKENSLLEYEMETMKKIHRKLLFSVDLLMASHTEKNQSATAIKRTEQKIRLIA